MHHGISWFLGEFRTLSVSTSVFLQVILYLLSTIVVPRTPFLGKHWAKVSILKKREVLYCLINSVTIVSTGFMVWWLWPYPFWSMLLNPFQKHAANKVFMYVVDWSISNTIYDSIMFFIGVRPRKWVYIFHHFGYLGAYVDSYFHPYYFLSTFMFYSMETSSVILNMVVICRNLGLTDRWYYLLIQKLFAFTFIALRNILTTVYFMYLYALVYKKDIRLESTFLGFYSTLYLLNWYWGVLIFLKLLRKMGFVNTRARKGPLCCRTLARGRSTVEKEE